MTADPKARGQTGQARMLRYAAVYAVIALASMIAGLQHFVLDPSEVTGRRSSVH